MNIVYFSMKKTSKRLMHA